MVMPVGMLLARDGSERARLRRCIRQLGPETVAKALGVSRSTVVSYASDASVHTGSEVMIILGLKDLESKIAG